MASVLVRSGIALSLLAMQTGNVTIGVGLDLKKGVLIQEYWESETPFYVIANLRKTPVKVSIHEWVNKKAGKQLIGPVEIAPNAIARVNALAAARDHELLSVAVEKEPALGLMRAPGKAPANKNQDIITCAGLNGIGGKRDDLWFSQQKPAYPAGAEFTIYLAVPDGIGTIQFSKEQKLTAHPAATLTRVVSESLPVTEDQRGFTIDATRATRVQETHSIELHIKAPRDRAPAMMSINGRVTTPTGGGFSITRGIPLVAPPDEKSSPPSTP
jgi:hypothetical protein